LSNISVTKSKVMFVHDRFDIDNEFNNSWYLFRVILIFLQVWQFQTYYLTFRIIYDQRWFFLNNLIVLFIFEWLDANWSCIFCMNDSRFDSNIMINSIACKSLSNFSNDKKIWFCCVCQSFSLSNISFACLIKKSAFSLNFSNK
jgi:hypothetical protein